ncbi:protein of unknown function [Methanoculleus bourgensis]|uniref:Uncharacterized protein n=1 Tax=Methanoculleus bourgensis TaxID=83986 RepID=A0A0X3BJA3_9EURY|nr:protein of unknown function [Methanoculleus bourgensis]
MLQLRSYGASFIATRGREREGVPLPVAVFHMKIPSKSETEFWLSRFQPRRIRGYHPSGMFISCA